MPRNRESKALEPRTETAQPQPPEAELRALLEQWQQHAAALEQRALAAETSLEASRSALEELKAQLRAQPEPAALEPESSASLRQFCFRRPDERKVCATVRARNVAEAQAKLREPGLVFCGCLSGG